MKKLSEIQQEFTVAIAQLINYCTARGVQLTFGDAYRDPRVFGELGVFDGYGSRDSNHKLRLAIDLNLFIDGKYISSGNHPLYREIGREWEKIHPLACWGGEFGDANHFSFEYNGYK